MLFVTNNSTKSRRTFKKKFDDLGLPAAQVRGRGGWGGGQCRDHVAARPQVLRAPCSLQRVIGARPHLAAQEEIYCSSYAAAAYLKSLGFSKKVWRSARSGEAAVHCMLGIEEAQYHTPPPRLRMQMINACPGAHAVSQK